MGSQRQERSPNFVLATQPGPMIHLDAGFLIRALVRNSAEDLKLRHWLKTTTPVGISCIAWAEFLCGPVETSVVNLAARIIHDRVPFLDEDAVMTARLFNLSGRRRGTLIDCMIAAVALRTGASLATTNSEDFRRLQSAGLEIVAS
ncbi:MAG TPA: type II toxin-antitoxin system VapC family toxin [Burkholderiales bacterium]|nr:type II toxin-antitoxin system VapC family toxin [Burkholderiales bacterium]